MGAQCVDAHQRAVLVEAAQQAIDQTEQALGGIVDRVHVHPDGVADRLGGAGVHRLVELLLALEDRVDGGEGDLRHARDLRDLGPLVTFLGEDLAGHGEHVGAAARGGALAAAGVRPGGRVRHGILEAPVFER